MTLADPRGIATGTSSRAALDAAQQALWRMMSFYDVPLPDLDRAIAADPLWALPHAMKAGFLLSLTEPGMVAQAQAHLRDAQLREAGAPAGERAHISALLLLAEGRWAAACRAWDELLLDQPRDALALQWAQLWDFYRGDAAGLRLRPARALPAWSADDPLYAHVLALQAFGLEECNLYPQAEEVGRRALQIEPRAPWAVHAVAHVMEMQGRHDEGSAWLRQHQPAWAEGNGFSGHLWWHQALFRLEGLDVPGVMRIIDKHLSGPALQITLQRVDAAALLWRLHLLGHDMAAQARALLEGWSLDASQAGHYAFNDAHALLALLAAGDITGAEAWLARCAEQVLAPQRQQHANLAMAREVGIPLARGLLAHSRGDHDAAATALYAVRAQAQRFGGSHAQRDVIDQTLMACAAHAGGRARAAGRAVLHERLAAKPATPLTRHWAEQLEVTP
ncbi:MAG: tetratricopeptide repeat protein [Aquabacterium sp.]